MPTVHAWHFTGPQLKDGRAIPPVGETLRHDGAMMICHNGFHASERVIDALQYAPGNIIHRVRMSGEVIRQDDKLCARERTILWSFNGEKVLRDFARAQARSVLHLWAAPEIVKRYLETGDEGIRDAAWDAAWAAAGAAARDAAWAAARAAAGAAANKELERLILDAANQQIETEIA